jgi:Zn-dependent peptidase ImmA (M78 family)/transcriptional regulator with XRE-family HTH domain
MKLGTSGFIGKRLREAREARGLTAIAVAGILGISRAAMSQYEKDDQTPRPEIMGALCKLLRLPESYFTRERTEHEGAIYWRSLASTKKAAREATRIKLDWFQDVIQFSQDFVEYPETHLPEIVLPRDPLRLWPEDIEKIATEVRTAWGLGDGPIPNAITIFENNGIFVSRDDLYAPELDGLSRWSSGGHPCCLIASGKSSAVRSRMDLFHELGHLVLHQNLDQRYVSSPAIHKEIERQAFSFAGAFSLPQESFASDVYSLSLDSFVSLKRRWKVAIGAMIKRCGDLRIANEGQMEKLWIARTARGWRTEEPLDDEIPIESPGLVSSAMRLIVDNKLCSEADIMDSLSLSASDIESLSGLPNEYLEKRADNVTVLRPAAAHPPRENGKATGRVINFKKDLNSN